MRENVEKYFETLRGIFDKVVATAADGRACEFNEAVNKSIRLIIDRAVSGGRVLLIGNGASASIASHIAVDLWKNAGIRAFTFNDGALLTCVSNDYGYERVFEKPIKMFAEPGDVLIGISSSGQSENILRGVFAAKGKKARIVTLSGFDRSNPLRKLGEINFYVPAAQYGYVETMHLSICHCLVDMIVKERNGQVQDRQPQTYLSHPEGA